MKTYEITGFSRKFAGFILSHGREWTAQALPEGEERGEIKQCFANSQARMVDDHMMGEGRLTYVEGYACSGALDFAFPVHHGWLVDEAGRVIDLTWEKTETATYFGVPFRSEYILEQVRKTEMWCSLLDNPYNDYALLRGLHPVATAVKEWRA